jgi:tRNA dimethylallyltransferase
MQVYRHLDIGTAKPTLAERALVAHHLVDVADANDDWSVARTQTLAREAVRDIEARRKRALLVGGTGLYVQAVIDPLAFPPEDRVVRERILARTDDLHADLRRRDPDAAAAIEPGNTRRIARALEVIEVTGRPFSSFGGGIQSYGPTVVPVRIAGVWLPRDVLNERIAGRVVAMRDAGLVDEVRELRARGALSRTAAQAIGYREVLDHLDDRASLDDALDAIVVRTRQFGRRQRMWFRRDPRITWFGAPANPCSILPALLASWSA